MSQSLPDLTEYRVVACRAADRARLITRRWFRTALSVDSKTDQTPVTIADREAEEAIRAMILDHFPEHGFLGEESGSIEAASEWQWVIDPIDGTRSFATGKPIFGTLIALLYQGQPVLGLIDQPILDERWLGMRGAPTTYNGDRCHCRKTTALQNATLYTTSPDMFDPTTRPQADRLAAQCQFRVFGGDCYGYGLVALGLNDLVCEADLKPYDYLALVPVVEGAGGRITDWHGQPLSLTSSGQVLASATGELHEEAVQILDGRL